MGSLYDEFEFLEDQENKEQIYGDDLYGWCMSHADRGKVIINEWDEYIPGTGVKRDMQSFGGKSHKLVQWKCNVCGESFKMVISCRTEQGQNCPKCGMRKRGETQRRLAAQKNNLKEWCLENGKYGQRLIEEWDQERNKTELGYDMEDLAFGTGLKVNWICNRCNEAFTASVSHRTLCGSGCPHCCITGTSYAELFIFQALRQIYPDTKHRAKEFDNIEFDITIPSRNFYIEYNGGYWHEGREDHDEYKRQLCEQNGIHLMQIVDDRKIDHEVFGDYEIRYKNSPVRQNQQLKEIVRYIVEMLGGDFVKIDIRQAIEKAGEMAYNEVELPVSEKFPKLMKEWLPELNNGLRPECFTSGSHQEITWVCSHCKGLWRNNIHSRTQFRSGCPRCGYNVFDNKIHGIGGNTHRLITAFGKNNL